MGTWIEIVKYVIVAGDDIVVPHVGTWIEIITPFKSGLLITVVPHVGTWIEIIISGADEVRGKRRSPRGNVD